MSWDLVVGQQEAVRRLEAAVTAPVHAYLFVGPGGAGKRRAATVFAGELLAAADPDNAERHRRLAVDESHADVHMLDPVGNNLRRDEEAEPLIVQASRSPVEGKRK
ncbi:MAG TPA: DNA polymerase III subunit delta', partial [Acidimicrobiaceae bacterium]|nr:DNA polymerase III subunit delta' [Acidimicrobiaceae bacterium]